MTQKIADTKIIEKSIKSLIKPKVDFILNSDLNPSNYKNVYENIHAEINNFISNHEKLIDNKFRSNRSSFKFKDNRVVLTYDKDLVDLIINDKKILASNIFGAKIDKETGVAKNIKIDLSSFKKEISKLF